MSHAQIYAFYPSEILANDSLSYLDNMSAKERQDNDDVSVRDYFEKILREQNQATRVAAAEREKAAANVRRALEENMKAGDDRLQDHIDHQIEQVKQALQSLSALLKERDARLDDRFASVHNALTEFKVFVADRFDSVNEFRGSLDDLGKLMATRRDLEALHDKVMPIIDRNREELSKMWPREAHEAWSKELDVWRSGMEKYRNEQAGRGEGITTTTKAIITAVTTLAVILGIIATYISLQNSSKLEKIPRAPETTTEAAHK